MLDIDNGGHISDLSKLPRCESGLIQLLSYNYEFKCGTETCTNLPDTWLSDLEEVSVHKMCSLRPKCVYPESSFESSQKNFQSILHISYTC